MRRILGNILMLALFASPAWAQARREAPVDLTGKWDFTVVSEGNTAASEVTLIQRSDSLIGRYTHQTLGALEVVGSVKGKEFVFAFNVPLNGQQLAMNIKGVVQTPDSLSGVATMGPMGSATFTAVRQRTPGPGDSR